MENELYIIWTSADPEVAFKMVFMYAHNSKLRKWWDQVNLIIWGPSSKLTGENPEIQKRLREMQAAGVKLSACKACSDQYGVTEVLTSLNVDVKYMGEPLTELLKAGKKVLTF